MNAQADKRVVVIAGPAGSGKDSIAHALVKRFSNVTMMITATTRTMREGEKEGENYYFFTNERFEKELEAGNIPEHYHRSITNTYYGIYEPDIEKRLDSGEVVIAVVQIVGAKYLKQQYNATTIFITPPSLEVLERRVKGRARKIPVSDAEWQERAEFARREIEEESPWYDYRITNDDGKLNEAIDQVVGILKKEGYTLE